MDYIMRYYQGTRLPCFVIRLCMQRIACTQMHWLCGDGNNEMRRRISQAPQGNRPEMQILAPFQLWEFLRFWLGYQALNGIVFRVFWQSTQLRLNMVPKRWKFLLKARNCFYERALDQNQWQLGEIHPVNRETRPSHSGDFHHWPRYGEIESRVMHTEKWRHEEGNCHVLT